MFRFFAFAFFMACRVSEMLKLHKDDFIFSPEGVGEKWVAIKLRDTKTRSRFVGDGHTVRFNKLHPRPGKKTNFMDPYELALFWYRRASNRADGLVAPWYGTFAKRSRALYSWFRHLKASFQHYLLRSFGLSYDCSEWRYHSIRTTFVGIMRQLGFSWEEIQLRTGHNYLSPVTRDCYFMNCLLTNETDQKFEKTLLSNIDAQDLFTLNGEFPDSSSSEASASWQQDEQHAEIYNTVVELEEADELFKVVTKKRKRKKVKNTSVVLSPKTRRFVSYR